jgi:dihydropteroate synthase/2-amino-4-hydroxy-6-hydroxymethyldihydropteridine diphosphokinase
MMANQSPGHASWHTVYLALGGNLGDRWATLVAALRRLGSGVDVREFSALYETPPWGITDQPAFYNLVVRGETALEPEALLRFVKEIEVALGRQPTVRYGPRPVDIDILLYDDWVWESDGLTIPHAGLATRAFVLLPLADIAPALVHPGAGETVGALLQRVDTNGILGVATGPELGAAVLENGAVMFGWQWGSRTYVMGIINATPDSFSGDGLVAMGEDDWTAAAIAQGQRFVREGAHILDVGGESTRPGSSPVTVEEELRRVVPVIAGLARTVPVPISVDTSKAVVAEAALRVGARLVNDVWGLRMDPALAAVVAAARAPVVLMHNRSTPKNAAQEARLGGRYVGVPYADLLGDVPGELGESVALARAAGIADRRIILDPGIGFGKTREQNLVLLDRLDVIKGMGYPVLVGPSRKSFIGYTLDLPPAERVEGTAAAVAVSIVRGADIVRVHDVLAMARVARMTDAIVRR